MDLPGPPELASLDLNLLVVLEALLAERNVTRAARRLGLTQPSTSHALARLRELLGDPILVRAGRGMIPTARAEALAPQLARALGEVRQLFARDAPFDPRTTRRSFTVACPDLLATIAPALVARIAREAPTASLELRGPIGADAALALGTGGIDLALAPAPTEGPGLVIRGLGSVRWCILARRDHPAIVRGAITLERWARWPHVVVRTGSESPSVVGRALAARGIDRRVGLVVGGFLGVPRIVAATELLAAAPRELVRDLARENDLAMLEPPIPIPAIPVAAIWHERWHADPAHAWLRAAVVEVVTDAVAEGGGTRGRRAAWLTGDRSARVVDASPRGSARRPAPPGTLEG